MDSLQVRSLVHEAIDGRRLLRAPAELADGGSDVTRSAGGMEAARWGFLDEREAGAR